MYTLSLIDLILHTVAPSKTKEPSLSNGGCKDVLALIAMSDSKASHSIAFKEPLHSVPGGKDFIALNGRFHCSGTDNQEQIGTCTASSFRYKHILQTDSVVVNKNRLS